MDSPPLAMVSSRPRRRLTSVYCFCFAILAVLGCGDEPLTSVTYRAIAPAAPLDTGGCPDQGGSAPLALDDATHVRLTYRATGGGPLRCDALLDRSAPPAAVAVPAGGALDVTVEYLRAIPAGGYRTVGVGSARGVDLAATDVVELVVTPRDGFSCGAADLAVPRAFHTATALPDGAVLVTGGIGGSGVIDLGQGLRGAAGIELLDPATGSWRQVEVPELVPRAMHRAVTLVTEADRVVIALVGGITVAEPAVNPLLVPGGPYRLLPAPAATGAPTELLTYTPSTGAVVRELIPPELDIVPRQSAAVAATARPVIVGGTTDGVTPDPTFQVLRADGAGAQATANLATPRIGASATALDPATALVWGGVVSEPPGPIGERLMGLEPGAVPSSTALSFVGDPPTPRAHHAAAAAGDGSVIVAGGFAPSAAEPVLAPVLAQRIVLSEPPAVQNLAVVGGNGAVPLAYPSATAVLGGDVVIAGGNPALGTEGCSGASGGLVCATGRGYRFQLAQLVLAEVGQLIVPRYGHQLTAVADGTVLVTGGLTATGEELRFVGDVERFDPRDESYDPIADLAPEVTRASGETAAPCVLVE